MSHKPNPNLTRASYVRTDKLTTSLIQCVINENMIILNFRGSSIVELVLSSDRGIIPGVRSTSEATYRRFERRYITFALHSRSA